MTTKKKENSATENIILSFVKYSLLRVFSQYLICLELDLDNNSYPLLLNQFHQNLNVLFWICEPVNFDQLSLDKIKNNLLIDEKISLKIINKKNNRWLFKNKYFILNEQLNFVYAIIIDQEFQKVILKKMFLLFKNKKQKFSKCFTKNFNKYFCLYKNNIRWVFKIPFEI